MVSKPGLILQHGHDGPPARFGDWLRERGLPFVVHHADANGPLPDPRAHSFVASLGSEHSVTESDGWVPAEVAMLREAVAADVPVLGLCFGGQALSLALGGGVDVLPTPEVGWIAVDSGDPVIPAGQWLQYHFDLMRVPPGGEQLATSPAGTAAFRHGRHLGLQFHPEADGDLLDMWARMDPKLSAHGITPEQLAAQSARHSEPARAQAFRLFNGWANLALPEAAPALRRAS